MKEGKPVGRPTKYESRYADDAYKYCLLGATDAVLAEFFEVTEQTINGWKKKHDGFFESIKKGRATADAKVAESLFGRANGYEYTEKKTSKRKVGENVTIEHVETVKHVAADTTAQIFWLKNRRPDEWREKKVIEHEGEAPVSIYLPDNGRDEQD